MSARQAKASRRDIRRALGPDVVAVVEAAAESGDVNGNNLLFLRDRLESAVQENAKHVTKLEALNLLREMEFQTFKRRNWRARLRWLVLGR